VRVVAPTRLLQEAAAILGPIREEVVVIGALAVQIALDGHDVALTPTRDIDAGVATESVDHVVAHLEENGLRQSDLPHEHSFTWVKDEVKVQLLRPFHPFPKGAASGLPTNNIIGELDDHRWLVSFEDDPDRGRFWAATPAALVGLKEAAFGRTGPSGEPVDRDFSDVALLLDRLGEEISSEVSSPSPMRGRVARAAQRLDEDDVALAAAARELVRSGHEDSQLGAEIAVRRTARSALRQIASDKHH
jgi:hypothetical protein